MLCCWPVGASVDTAVAGALAVVGTPAACTADNVAPAAVESTLLAVCEKKRKISIVSYVDQVTHKASAVKRFCHTCVYTTSGLSNKLVHEKAKHI